MSSYSSWYVLLSCWLIDSWQAASIQSSHDVKVKLLSLGICQGLHCSLGIEDHLDQLSVVKRLALTLLNFKAAAAIQHQVLNGVQNCCNIPSQSCISSCLPGKKETNLDTYRIYTNLKISLYTCVFSKVHQSSCQVFGRKMHQNATCLDLFTALSHLHPSIAFPKFHSRYDLYTATAGSEIGFGMYVLTWLDMYVLTVMRFETMPNNGSAKHFKMSIWSDWSCLCVWP